MFLDLRLSSPMDVDEKAFSFHRKFTDMSLDIDETDSKHKERSPPLGI